MPKPEREFFLPDHIPWQPVTASPTAGVGGAGVQEKILSMDEDSGDVTRLVKFDAGVETTDTIVHDFWEEVWILQGGLIDLGKNQFFTAGMYACRPPGMVHGPYRVPRGCVTLEFRSCVPWPCSCSARLSGFRTAAKICFATSTAANTAIRSRRRCGAMAV